MRLAVAFVLLSLTGAAHAAPNKNIKNHLHEHETPASSHNHNLLRGRQLQADPATVTKWDNNRISDTNPDGLPLDPETGLPDCLGQPCYADHYDGPVDVGDVNRVVGNAPAGNDGVEQAALQLALAEAEAALTTRGQQTKPNPNPHIVYDVSTGHKYDLTTGQKIVIEEVEKVSLTTGQETVDVKVYVVDELPADHPAVIGAGAGTNKAPGDVPLPAVPGAGAGAGSGPLDDPTPPSTCSLARDAPCGHNEECASGCCAVLATKTKCVDPAIPVFKEFCPIQNRCNGVPGTKAEPEPEPPQQPPRGIPDNKDTDTGSALYTVGTYTSSGPDPSNPSSPNRVVGGGDGQGDDGDGQGDDEEPDCTGDKVKTYKSAVSPSKDECQSSCQCESECCVSYGLLHSFQICVDGRGIWEDKCI
mmetsp:Transcript_13154/g.37474  ORF Transcript_13154/g.37474 Transcript_13154/m.37474 type:complete len:417 (-) Transcript_13154:297-1547(-)